MDQQDLLSRVQNLAATSEGLGQLLRQMDAALDEDQGEVGADGTDPGHTEAAPLLRRARDMLTAFGRLATASEDAHDVLVPSSLALVATAQEQQGAHRELIEQSRVAIARSRELPGRAGEEPERRPAPGAAVAAAGAAFLFAKVERYGRLPDEDRAAIAGAIGRARHASPGSELLREGSHPGSHPGVSILLLDGFAARCKVLRGGERQITTILVPGDFVDLHSFLLRPVDHAAVALTGCTVAAVPHEALRRIADSYPRLRDLLWLDTLVDGAIHREWLVGMGRRSALGHMAHLLCELFLRLRAVGLADEGGPGGERRFRLPLTQVDLADALGLSCVHVNRTLRQLREQGLVTRVGGVVTIQDWDRLVQVAEFSAAYLGSPHTSFDAAR